MAIPRYSCTRTSIIVDGVRAWGDYECYVSGYWFVDDTPSSGPGGGDGSIYGTPISDSDLGIIRSRIPEVLTERCVSLINQLVRAHTKNDKFDAKEDLLKTFDFIKANGPSYGFRWWTKSMAGKREITLSRPGSLGLNILTVIHELIHVASGPKGADWDLTDTTLALGIKVYNNNGSPMKYDPKNSDDRSGYWAQALMNHCNNVFETRVGR